MVGFGKMKLSGKLVCPSSNFPERKSSTAKKIEVEFANSIRDIWVFMCHPSKWPYHLDQQTIHYVVRYGMYRLGTKRAVIACGGVPTVLDR